MTNAEIDAKNAIEYAIGYDGVATGVKVFKDGIEGYRLGDFSCGTCAGNLRAACYEEIECDKDYTITVNYGGPLGTGKSLLCYYTDGETTSKVLDYKLEAYNKDVFNSVTKDDKHMYMKLVNADNFVKPTRVVIKDLSIASEAKMVVITGDIDIAYTANVNKKNKELVVPAESKINFENGEALVMLPANSVVAVIAEII